MFFSFLSLFLTSAYALPPYSRRDLFGGNTVCSQIAGNITGDVYYPLDLSPNFLNDTEHWMSSSSQTPQCVVEVATPQDVSNVMKIVGATRTPFAVKSGGHASNQGFSSTTGVFISLVRMTQVVLSSDKKTAEVGLGNVWTQVYAALDGTGVNIVGGRVSGPGTGGFTLGGGYAWKTNQYGLTCDTVHSYNLVLPDGTITTVDSTKPDLFFALKGGLNRFGIVTSIVYNTVPQPTQPTQVYGGLSVYTPDKIPSLLNATQAFYTTNTDPKAQLITTINGGSLPGAIVLFFYDGPTKPSSFSLFDTISPLITTVKTQSYASFSTSTPSQVEAGNRGAFASISTTSLTPAFMVAVANESSFYSQYSLLNSGGILSYDIEPFGKYGVHATDSAYPHKDSQLPLNLYFAWTLESEDAFWRAKIQDSIDTLTEVAKKEGIWYPVTYPNYALSTSAGSTLYGDNVGRLRRIQAKYDPMGVMGLTGGFEF